MGKGVMFTMRGCFRSITNYPFLVFLLCGLIFMYMSSPFMFSLLVSASPVLVCTAVLLGTLLFYGKPNIPEIEVDEKTTDESDVLKDEKRKDEVELRKVEETECESENENDEVLEEKRELNDGIAKGKDEWSYERFAKMKGVESECEKSEAESCDSEMVWKGGDGGEKEEGLDSGSEAIESSSSSNESMADVMPMLDELHPLLNEDSSQLLQMSRVCSEAPSELSPRTSISSVESVEVYTNENEGNKGGGKEEDQEKAAIIWTEEDQKNVMDLGSSEIERNKRLENLLMRRMRRNTSMLPEINLIDLDSCDFASNISHISTTRQNPFDPPHDPYFHLGLPPLPSSAPPVLLQKRNPFEVPYEANPYHRFQEELKTSESREAFFRRHEHVSVGPSVFAPKRPERQDLKWGPIFLPEQIALELGSLEKSHSQDGLNVEQTTSEMSGQTCDMITDTNASVEVFPRNDPVYDSSPNAVKTNSSFSSSPNSQDDYVEANDKLISTPTAGGVKPHFHDRLLHEHQQEVQVPNTPIESHEEVRSIENIYIPELHELEINETKQGQVSEMDDEKELKPNTDATSTKSEENAKEISVNRRFSTPF